MSRHLKKNNINRRIVNSRSRTQRVPPCQTKNQKREPKKQAAKNTRRNALLLVTPSRSKKQEYNESRFSSSKNLKTPDKKIEI